MSDVFLSYLSDDRSRVADLAGALVELGWDVWWDRSILPGKTFDQVIEEELAAASCVVVVWTEGSVDSRWVRTEAAEGLERGILVPVLFDAVPIPLAFKRVQAADLTDWKPGEPHGGFDELVKAISAVVGHLPQVPSRRADVAAARIPATPIAPIVQTSTETGREPSTDAPTAPLNRTGEFETIDPAHPEDLLQQPPVTRPLAEQGRTQAPTRRTTRPTPSDTRPSRRRRGRMMAFGVLAVTVVAAAVVAVIALNRTGPTDPATAPDNDVPATSPDSDIAAVTYDQAVLEDDPLVYWPLASDGAVELRDSVGQHDLTPRDDNGSEYAPTFVNGPNEIGGVDLDGSKRLETSFNPSTSLAMSSWTLELWMNLDADRLQDRTDTFAAIGGWNPDEERRFYFNVRDRKPCVGIGGGISGGNGWVCATVAVNDGTWHHITMSYQAETGEVRLFLDASEVALEANPWGPNEKLTDAEVAIGAILDDREADGVWHEYWEGGLSRVAIYDHVLSPQQVRAHYEASG